MSAAHTCSTDHPRDRLAVLLAAERPRVVRLCARLTGDAAAAEDLAQETLLEAWRRAARLADPAGAPRWVAAIARHVCRRWMRGRARDLARLAPLPDDEAAGAPLPAALATADDDLTLDLERDALARVLDRALAALSPETRAVVLARCLDDLPQAEVALRLGLSEGAVALRLHRGRLALRRVLAGELRDEPGAGAEMLAGAATWRETSMWCTECGRSRLEGRFSPARGELILRCPACATHPGYHYCWHISHCGLLDGVSGLKPAFTRVLRWGNAYYRRALATGRAPCTHCGRPAPLLMGLPPGHPAAAGGQRHFHVACAACGYPENNGSLDFLVLGLPEAGPFWRAHPRIRRLPERTVEAEGRPALVVGYESLESAARLEAVVARDDFAVLRVAPALGP